MATGEVDDRVFGGSNRRLGFEEAHVALHRIYPVHHGRDATGAQSGAGGPQCAVHGEEFLGALRLPAE